MTEATRLRPAPGGAAARGRAASRRARTGRRPASRRTRLVALLVAAVALAGGGFLVATRTGVFALRSIEVRGGSPALAAEARASLRPLLGTSLVALDGGSLDRRLEALPEVVSASYDRAFPHTLRIELRPERPVAILRQGRRSWLLSARGRVMRPLAHPQRSSLPRIWVGAREAVVPGRVLGVADGGRAARALAALGRLPLGSRVRLARADAHTLTFVLRSGLELRLGSPAQLRLKLAIARRILTNATSLAYLDVSVPERPVAAEKSKVEG